MGKLLLFLMFLLPLSVQAEIFKCESLNGRKVFQSTPCSRDTKVVEPTVTPTPDRYTHRMHRLRVENERKKCDAVRRQFVLAFLAENGNKTVSSALYDRSSSSLNEEMLVYCGVVVATQTDSSGFRV